MSLVKIQGNASGTGVFTVASPNSNTDRTLTLPDNSGTVALTSDLPYALTSGTSVASTSGTSIDFTSIPSWVKRITVMFSGLSTNGTSNILIQIGSGSVTTSGYASGAAQISNAVVNSTAGFIQTYSVAAVNQYAASCFILNTGTNSYLATGSVCTSNNANNGMFSNGYVTLSGALDRIRITTVNGTDTFDAGSINILYE